MDVLKWLAKWIPEDKTKRSGWGPFNLETLDPEAAAWMGPILRQYHDPWFKQGPELDPPMRLSDIDVRIWKALTIAATLPELDPIVQCHRLKDIAFYWPKMHSAGHYLYGRDKR